MKIIIVNKFHYIKGGSETYCFALAEALRALGHEVHAFSMQDEHNVPSSDESYFVSHRDYNGSASLRDNISSAINLIWSRESFNKFQALCCLVKPDIIHLNLVNRQITLSILDVPYIREHNTPVVYTAHEYISLCPCYTMLDGNGEICEDCVNGNYLPCIRKKCVKQSRAKSVLAALEAFFVRARKYYERFDLVVAPSEFIKKKMVEGGFSGKKIRVMQNFLPNSTINEIKEVSDGSADTSYFIYFGRISKEKGVDVLLKAYAEFIKQCSRKIKLEIVGTGPMEEQAKAVAKKLGIANYVGFRGFMTGIALRELVKAARFSIIPSVWYENMPYSGLESLASGTPVIGARIGGIPEFVIDGETGFLCTPGNVEELKRALLQAADMRTDQYQTMVNNCIDYIRLRCGQDGYAISLADEYRRLLSARADNNVKVF